MKYIVDPEFVKKGVRFKLMMRNDQAAWYTCTYSDKDSKNSWYEVHELRTMPPRTFAGVTIPEYIKWPSDEDFGTYAKSFFDGANPKKAFNDAYGYYKNFTPSTPLEGTIPTKG